MPVWKFLDRMTWMFRGSALPKTLAILGLIGAGLLAMVIVPIDFDLEGNGKLKPSIEKNVFAHVDGEVQAVKVKHSQKVNEGDILVELKNRELDGQITNIEGELLTARKKNENASYNLNQKGLQPSDKERYKSEEAETKTTIANRTNDLQILLEKKSDYWYRYNLGRRTCLECETCGDRPSSDDDCRSHVGLGSGSVDA
jgi:multidrug resistance efflux pump